MCFFLPGLQMILCNPAQFKYLFSTSYAFLSIYEQPVLFYSLLYIFCSLFFRHCLSYIIHWYIIHRRMIFCLFLQPRLRLLIESLLARNRIQMFLPFLSRYIMNRYRHNLPDPSLILLIPALWPSQPVLPSLPAPSRVHRYCNVWHDFPPLY